MEVKRGCQGVCAQVPEFYVHYENDIISHSSGMAYVAALLLMHMNEEVCTYTCTVRIYIYIIIIRVQSLFYFQDAFWSVVALFESEEYLSGFYDCKLSR